MGGPAVREALEAGRTVRDISDEWSIAEAAFADARAGCLLYS